MFENLSTIISEKLQKDNFQAWKFMMTNFLMEKGVWPFINGDEQEPVLGAAPTIADLKTFREWHEKAMKVMYWLSVSVLDSMIVHIQDAKMPKEAWDTLVKLYNTNTTTWEMQLKHELHNV